MKTDVPGQPALPRSDLAGANRARSSRKATRRLRWAVALGLAVALGGAALRAWSWLDPDRLWAEARGHLIAGRFAKAEALLGWIHRLRDRTTLDWLLAAQVAAAQERLDDALAALRHVPDSDPMAAQALMLAGRLERQRKHMRGAEAAFLRALEVAPDLVAARKELIYLYGVQMRRGEADAQFLALSRLAPPSFHDLFTWTLTHFAIWQTDVAVDLEGFLRADPGDRDSRLALAEVYRVRPGMEGRVKEVLKALPATDPDARALLAQLALDTGDLPGAEALLGEAAADNANLARVRGRAAMIRRDYPAAVRHFRKALSPERFDRASSYDLGRALVLAGDPAAAEPYLTRYRKLSDVYDLAVQAKPGPDGSNPDLLRIGGACEAAGLLEEARGWYSLAIGENPLDPKAQAAFRRVAGP